MTVGRPLGDVVIVVAIIRIATLILVEDVRGSVRSLGV
jgi:hypothetical protein